MMAFWALLKEFWPLFDILWFQSEVDSLEAGAARHPAEELGEDGAGKTLCGNIHWKTTPHDLIYWLWILPGLTLVAGTFGQLRMGGISADMKVVLFTLYLILILVVIIVVLLLAFFARPFCSCGWCVCVCVCVGVVISATFASYT